jgi:hypothetical protein
VVRAPPAAGVTNLALRKDARVASVPLAPVMAFIDTSDTIIGVTVQQIDARYVASGQEVELTFKFMPGKIYSPKVQAELQAIATGQVQGAHAVSENRSLACASSWEALGELLVVKYYAYNKRCCLDRFRSDSEAPMSSARSFCASWR